MSKALLNTQNRLDINSLLQAKSQTVLIVGEVNSGKYFIARYIACGALNIDDEKLDVYPYLMHISQDTIIGIDDIRGLKEFLQLRTTGSNNIRRVVIIESADTMTIEAQNALLKTLEEPPQDTIIIMTAVQTSRLLPTILSRLQQLNLKNPSYEQIKNFYSYQIAEDKLTKLYELSSGRMGLLSSLLEYQNEHPIYAAITKAKELLSLDTYNRLVLINEIVAEKNAINQLFDALIQIATTAISRASEQGKDNDIKRWYKVLKAVHNAQYQYKNSVSLKLLLTNLMFNM